jgi:hypothetical protein
MIKRFLPLALMLAWAPAAPAFPPCPERDVHLSPLGSPPDATELWFQAEYVMSGNQDVIGELKSADDPKTGKCKDRVPVPDANISDGTIELGPRYAPNAGFGIISLPELPTIAENHLRLEYRLDFTVENAALARTGDWIDFAQFEFAHDRKQAGLVSAVYRVRKIQHGKGPATVEVIESRADIGPPYTKPPLFDRVVAEIPLQGVDGKTAIALRWTQHAQTPIEAELADGLEAPAGIEYNVDSVLEVLGPSKGNLGPAEDMLYSTSLPRQWADTLSMGLLDYNIPDDAQYGSGFRLVVDDSQLSANTSDRPNNASLLD